MFNLWKKTDPDCCQYVRNNGSVYEMIQAIWLDLTEEDKAKGFHEYCICRGEIDISQCDDNDVINAISSYGYSIVNLISQYGNVALDIIAECILEEEIGHDGCVIADADSFEEANKIIDDIVKKEDEDLCGMS